MLWPLPGSMKQKLDAVVAAGLTHVSLTSEHARWTAADRSEFAHALNDRGLRVHMIAGNPRYDPQEAFGHSMCDPAKRPALLDDIRCSAGAASELGARTLLLLAGNIQEGMPRERQYEELLESSKRCADVAERVDCLLVLEPLNSKLDHPRHFLVDVREAARISATVGSRRLTVAVDLYHQEAECRDAVAAFASVASATSMVHVADFPGRGEPGSGGLDFDAIYRILRDARHPIDVVFEYEHTGDPSASLERAITTMRNALRDTMRPPPPE